MKIIIIFYISTILSFSSNCELVIPKYIKSESIKKVIENDWTFASKRIKKFIEHNSTSYVDRFMQLIEQSLILKTDEEYIQEQVKRHIEFLNDKNLTKLVPSPIGSIDDYKQRLNKEVKYNIYSFNRYKYTINRYSGIYLYIRYLESIKQLDKAFEIYDKIAKRFLDTYNTQSKISINVMILNFKLVEYIKALTVSLKMKNYTITQKQLLYKNLSKFLLDKNLFSKMLKCEKQELFKYLDMFYLDENASAETMMQNERFFTGMLKLIDESNLKVHLNNKETVQKIVRNYKFDLEQIHKQLLLFNNIKEYEVYVEKKESISEVFDYISLPRIFLLYVGDDMKYASLSNALKYHFSSDEFIHFIRKFYIFYGKPWIFGKYKFEYEKDYEGYEKFLFLLKN